MPYEKNKNYRDLPFCHQTPYADFYIYCNISELVNKCKFQKDEITRCRTVGILRSTNGRFFISDLDLNGEEYKPQVCVSVVYLKSPPSSTVIPYPVQVFGTLQWRNRPVIFANMLQELSVPMALLLRSTLSAITCTHLATAIDVNEDNCNNNM